MWIQEGRKWHFGWTCFFFLLNSQFDLLFSLICMKETKHQKTIEYKDNWAENGSFKMAEMQMWPFHILTRKCYFPNIISDLTLKKLFKDVKMHDPVSTQLHARHKLLNMIETNLPNIYVAQVNIWQMLEPLKCLQWNI